MTETTVEPKKTQGARRIALFLSPQASLKVRELLRRADSDRDTLNDQLQEKIDALAVGHLTQGVIDLMEALRKSLQTP